MKPRKLVAGLLALLMLTLSLGAFAEPHDTAYLQAFIQNDPLNGDNGMEPNPLAPLIYGPVNIGFDVNGNAIEAVDEQDFFYANGYYYLIGQSFAEGAFNYAPGVPYNETLSTNPATFYRWSGLVTYRSEDLENWTLVSRFYPQEAGTGRHIVIKKPRMCYSAATGKYVMWFLNNTAGEGEAPIMVMTADSPEGPWSKPQPPTVPEGVTYSDLTHDYQIKVDPATGIGWYTQAGATTHLYRMTPEMTGVEEDFSFKVRQKQADSNVAYMGSFATNPLAGGMGFFYRDGWWYIYASPACGNCIGAQLSYVMARSPEGPWLSPETMTADEEVIPKILSTDSLLAQTHGAVMFQDQDGNPVFMGYGTHYRSSATGANSDTIGSCSGDNSLALSGQFWFTFDFEEDGRIRELKAKEYYEIPLDKTIDSEHADAYQADVSITAIRSARQVFTVEEGKPVACILPSVFQFTPDRSPSSSKWIAQDALLDAPLVATLELPDGVKYTWTIDARSIAFAPRQIALNLAEVYTGGGQLTLTLSTKAGNGGYGVALGSGSEYTVYSHVDIKGSGWNTQEVVTEFPGQMIYLRTSDTPAEAPVITTQPVDITVTEGTRVGFLVQAEGIGVGYQWYHDGQIVMPHGVTAGTRNESASAALRLSAVTMEDTGVYMAEAINAVGKVQSVPVTLTVLPKE